MDIREQVAEKILRCRFHSSLYHSEEIGSDTALGLADRIIPLVRADTLKVATNRIKALEDLLVCYRIGKHPTEGLHTRLDKSGKDWDALSGKEGE